MLIKIVQIGNSQGIRLPKAIIEQCELGDEVEAIVKDKKIILSAKKKIREAWAEWFDRENTSEGLCDEPVSEDLQDWLKVENEFDREQW